MSIEVKNINKRFGTFQALDDVSLHVPTGSLVALLGPSGSGKTTLLRVIAGLEQPDQGEVLFQGEDATQRKLGERRVGFVFQHYALFRHMSVFENVAFGLRVRPRKYRPTKAEIKAKVHELLSLVQLDGLADRRPSQLSGGQRQRVALARALAVEPQVLLLDEPFGALDARVRQELRRWLRRFHDELHITSVFVTHDQEEALEVADTVVVMNKGKIEQVGSPDEVYDHPQTPFVLNFLGDVNVFRGREAHLKLQMGSESYSIEHRPDGAEVYARPDDLRLVRNGPAAALKAIVRRVVPLGPIVRIELERCDNGDSIEARLARSTYADEGFGVGEVVSVVPRSIKHFEDGVGRVQMHQP